MTPTQPQLSIDRLAFEGSKVETVGVEFRPGLNVLYGASNTGKTFTVKSIDFMLGGKGPLPDISQRNGYDRAWMGLTLPKTGASTLMRALAGGSYELYGGHISAKTEDIKAQRKLSARNDPSNADNISQFLLGELGLVGKKVATDVNGNKKPLSFRDLVRFCLVDETSI